MTFLSSKASEVARLFAVAKQTGIKDGGMQAVISDFFTGQLANVQAKLNVQFKN